VQLEEITELLHDSSWCVEIRCYVLY